MGFSQISALPKSTVLLAILPTKSRLLSFSFFQAVDVFWSVSLPLPVCDSVSSSILFGWLQSVGHSSLSVAACDVT